jgi:TPR repeat protein
MCLSVVSANFWEANDAGAIYILGSYYAHGQLGLQQDLAKALELWTEAANFGSSHAHYNLVMSIDKGEIQRRPSFTTRPRLWLDMKLQDTTVD